MQIQDASVLIWFLSKGGVLILTTWLSQAASEEQTSVLLLILKVLCHLPLHKASPENMSAILQSVNGLRFYRISDQTYQTGQKVCYQGGPSYLRKSKL